MGLIGEGDRQHIQERFAKEMQDEVTLRFFSRGSFHQVNGEETGLLVEEEACQVTYQLYQELAEIEPRFKLDFVDLDTPEGKAIATENGLDGAMLPVSIYQSTSMAGQSRFFGMPTGYEFGTLLENIIDLSSNKPGLSKGGLETVGKIEQDARIIVFVTPT